MTERKVFEAIAKVEAERELVKLGYSYPVSIERLETEFVVNIVDGGSRHFPFVGPRNGDSCLCKRKKRIEHFYYFDGKYYEIYEAERGFLLYAEISELIAVTSFNVLDHLDTKKEM